MDYNIIQLLHSQLMGCSTSTDLNEPKDSQKKKTKTNETRNESNSVTESDNLEQWILMLCMQIISITLLPKFGENNHAP